MSPDSLVTPVGGAPGRGPQAPLPPPTSAARSGVVRSVGFRNSPDAARQSAVFTPAAGTPPLTPAPTVAVARPTPLPRRPTGRLFVGVAVLGVGAGLAYTLWSTFFRYQACGTVAGRIIIVSSAQSGVLQSLPVREGDLVTQGQLLATLTNLDLNQRLDRIGDELRMAQAQLDAELTELKWQTRLMSDRDQHALSEYYQRWGQLLEEQAKLTDLEIKLTRKRDADQQHGGAITREELDSLQYAAEGQKAKVDKLNAAVAELRKLADLPLQESLPGQLQPKLTRIEMLQAELARLRENVRQTEIRSPVQGRVVKSHRFTGEYVAVAAPLMEILEELPKEATAPAGPP